MRPHTGSGDEGRGADLTVRWLAVVGFEIRGQLGSLDAGLGRDQHNESRYRAYVDHPPRCAATAYANDVTNLGCIHVGQQVSIGGLNSFSNLVAETPCLR